MNLIIKGNKLEAARAAKDRDIPLEVVRETRKTGADETIGKTDEQHRKAVVDWFNEEPRTAPFPIGALLLFST